MTMLTQKLVWKPIKEAPIDIPVLIYDANTQHSGCGLAIAEQGDDGVWLGCDDYSNYVQYNPSHWALVFPPFPKQEAAA